jgi:hypothetical protein
MSRIGAKSGPRVYLEISSPSSSSFLTWEIKWNEKINKKQQKKTTQSTFLGTVNFSTYELCAEKKFSAIVCRKFFSFFFWFVFAAFKVQNRYIIITYWAVEGRREKNREMLGVVTFCCKSNKTIYYFSFFSVCMCMFVCLRHWFCYCYWLELCFQPETGTCCPFAKKPFG